MSTATSARAPGSRRDLAGTRHLVRLILRRDRLRLPLWVLGVTALTAVSASAAVDLYDTPDRIAGYARTTGDSAASRLLNGSPVAIDGQGGITAYEVTSTAGVLVALMVVFLVVRHTRAEEESGRAELLRATVLGRHAATVASLLVATGASALVGILDALVLLGLELEASGAVLHGSALAAVGLVFTAVAAAAAQVTSAARGALGLAGGVLAAAFVVRGVGAVQGSGLTWVSPLGWQQEVAAFGDERWWPVLVALGVAAAILAATAYLTAHRDAGSGLLAPRPGPARASRALSGAAGLALRLQRGLVLGWAIGLGVMAGLLGGVGDEVVSLASENPDVAAIVAAGGGGPDRIVEEFFSFGVAFLVVLASAFAVASALRVRAEETSGRAEVLLAGGLSRTRWLLGGLAVTVAATLLQLVLAGVAIGGVDALVAGDTGRLAELLVAPVSQAPAVLAVAGVAVLLQGWWPRWSVLAWAVVGFALLQSYLAELLSLPEAISALSPFWHLPALPADDFTAGPALVVGAVALALGAAGLVGLRRRDVG